MATPSAGRVVAPAHEGARVGIVVELVEELLHEGQDLGVFLGIEPGDVVGKVLRGTEGFVEVVELFAKGCWNHDLGGFEGLFEPRRRNAREGYV